jgi:hypothetical protein
LKRNGCYLLRHWRGNHEKSDQREIETRFQ